MASLYLQLGVMSCIINEGLEGTCRTSLLHPFTSKPHKAACGLHAGKTRSPGLSEPPASVAGSVCIALGSVRWSGGSGRGALAERGSVWGSGIAARFSFASPGPGTDWQRQQQRAYITPKLSLPILDVLKINYLA